MMLKEKLKEELSLFKEIEETKIQIRKTKSLMRKKDLARHLHKLENKWRKEFG